MDEYIRKEKEQHHLQTTQKVKAKRRHNNLQNELHQTKIKLIDVTHSTEQTQKEIDEFVPNQIPKINQINELKQQLVVAEGERQAIAK